MKHKMEFSQKMNSSKAIEYVSLPMEYMQRDQGRGIMSTTVRAINHWFRFDDEEKISKFNFYLKTIVNATLLADDIEDGSLKRRGMPCGYLVYGAACTINSFPYYYLQMLQNIVDLADNEKDKVEMMKQMITQLSNVHLGQAMEMHWNRFSIVPTEEEYYQMVDLKSSYFIKMPYEFLKIMTQSDLDMNRLCYLSALYYQIKDDYINLKWDSVAKAKGSIGDDITEGKFSFPIIHGIRNSKDSLTILNILKAKTDSEELKQLVIDILEQTGSFEYTFNILQDLRNQLLNELKKFSDNQFFEKFISSLLIEEEQMF